MNAQADGISDRTASLKSEISTDHLHPSSNAM